MSTFVFHNNFHRSNHHTVALSGLPESAVDPIASLKYPFQGIFYNNCSDFSGNFIGFTNSYEWWSSYKTTKDNYIEWGKYPTTYTTVRSNSAYWQNIKSLYNTYNALSSKWNSSYKTLFDNEEAWKFRINGYQMYSDSVQVNTRQKTFKSDYIYPDKDENIIWDLDSSQVSFYLASNSFYFSAFNGAKRGGKYDLLVITDATCNPTVELSFNPERFVFPNHTYNYSISGIHGRKFSFLSDGKRLLCGKVSLYDLNPPERNVYYAGAGILLYENYILRSPLTLDDNERLYTNLGGGLTVRGVDPYGSSSSVIVDGKVYNKDYIFTFTSVSALCAFSPYGQIGSQDRVLIKNPNITMINALSSTNSIELNKCGGYENIQIITRAYGYISQLIINDDEIKDFVLNESDGYSNHETGHIIERPPSIFSSRIQSYFIKFGNPVPIQTASLSSGLSLWLDAMDFSTVDFLKSGGNNYITGLSSKIEGKNISFSSSTNTNTYYNTLPKQSFNYNLSSTHYRDLVLSGDKDFLTFTVLTPSNSSNNTEWLWANGNYGIFKIPYEYSLGIGTSAQYYKYTYGNSNKNKPVLITTRYLKNFDTQETFINSNFVTNLIKLSSAFISNNANNNYTAIGSLNPLTGFSTYKLHELLIYEGYKNNILISEINNYLFDKWKFL
jgi:hypothetical protein